MPSLAWLFASLQGRLGPSPGLALSFASRQGRIRLSPAFRAGLAFRQPPWPSLPIAIRQGRHGLSPSRAATFAKTGPKKGAVPKRENLTAPPRQPNPARPKGAAAQKPPRAKRPSPGAGAILPDFAGKLFCFQEEQGPPPRKRALGGPWACPQTGPSGQKPAGRSGAAGQSSVSPKAKCPILAHSKDVLLTGPCQGWARGGSPPVPILGMEDAC